MTAGFASSADGTHIAYNVTGQGPALRSAGFRVEAMEGLDHLQEFTEIDRVFPVVRRFFATRPEE